MGCSVSVRTHSVKTKNLYVVIRLSGGLQNCSGWFLNGCLSQKRVSWVSRYGFGPSFDVRVWNLLT